MPAILNRTSRVSSRTIRIPTATLDQMRNYVDDQMANAKLMQGEIDLLTHNYTEYSPTNFLNDLKSRRNISI